MWKTPADSMSIHDDSSTVLSVRASDAGLAADQAEKHDGTALPNFYGKSPYTDTSIVALDVGLAKTRYRIHASVLAVAPELASKPALKLWGEKTNDTVALPELDAVTAHTLVTFLYTGRYETLTWLGEDDKKAVASYTLAACVYAAGVRYKIPVLAALAQDNITTVGRHLTILDVLGVARDHAFPILPDEETWFARYLEDAIKAAAAKDPGLFVKEGFVEMIEGDRRFRQVVMRAIVGTYAAGGIGGGDDPPMDVATGEAKTAGGVAAEEQRATAINGDNEDVVQLDDIEPSLADSPVHRPASPGSPAAPESVTDELDFKNSKTYQSMGRPPGHARHDSVIERDGGQVEEAPFVGDGNEEEKVASPAAEVVVVNGTICSAKKNKNKKKKKNSVAVLA